jgi:hypothetical protein
LCGDARNPACFAHLLAGKMADLMFTDPPYNVRIDGHVSGRGRHRHQEFAMASGEMKEAEFIQFLSATLGLAMQASRDGALHYVAWIGATCSSFCPRCDPSMATSSTFASGTRTMVAWGLFIGPSMN